MTAAGGTAGDEANEAVSPDATTSQTKTIRMQIPIRDGDAHLAPRKRIITDIDAGRRLLAAKDTLNQ
jgi:hypothetical protein